MRTSRRFLDGGRLQAGLIVLLATGCSDVGGAERTSGTPVSGDEGDRHGFGRLVAVSGGVALVGSMWDDDPGTASGSAYVLDLGSA